MPSEIPDNFDPKCPCESCRSAVAAFRAACRTCDRMDDHDPATLAPRGVRCGARATLVVLWSAGVFGGACDAHAFEVLMECPELIRAVF